MSTTRKPWETASAEPARLDALAELDILDSPREPAFDRVCELIRLIFGVEIGLVTLIDGHRQWYKAAIGMSNSEQALDTAFCRFTLADACPVVVPDARLDERFADHEKVLGAPHIRFYAGVPISTRKGQLVGTICAIDTQARPFEARDVAILQQLASLVMHGLELRQEAVTDALTGISSRRSFKHEASRHVALSHRNALPLSCITLDIDHFKHVNDTYGHAVGDQVLIGVSAALKDNLRQSDIFGRIGGEEFAIILPQTEAATAVALAEKLRKIVKDLRFPGSNPPIAVSLSFGVAGIAEGDDIETLLARSDHALYQAKRSGRDRVCLAQSPAEPEKINPRRVLRAGQIIFDNGRSAYDCTIRSIWQDGAEIMLSLPSVLPDTFELVFKGTDERHQCQLTKRSATAVEVRYLR